MATFVDPATGEPRVACGTSIGYGGIVGKVHIYDPVAGGAALVVTNLPYMTHLPPAFFVDYVDAMTDGLGAVLLVRGSGQEVVTKYG